MNHSSNVKSIAILGGTFDPIHNGHIFPASHVRKWLGVDYITLLPANIPPHKEPALATAIQRTDMVKSVCQHEEGFLCDARELTRAIHSYTVDSLKEIKVESPESQLFFIIGMDSLHTFMQWHSWQEILTLCHLVVNVRPNYQLNELSVAMQALVEECRYTEPSQTTQTSQTVETSHENLFMAKGKQKTLANSLDKTSGYILFSPASDYDISSTYIRAVLNRQQGKNNLLSSQKLSLLPTLLPKYVINYINQHHLYQK